MSSAFYNLDLKEKIDLVRLSPYEWSQNLICIAFRSKVVIGIIKFQEEFDDLDQDVEFEQIEEFFHRQRVHAISWSPVSSLNKLPKTVEVCVAGSDFSLRVFSSNLTSKRRSRKEIEGHSDYINDCAYDPEGEYLASVSDDCTCKLWSSGQNFELVNTFHLTSPGMSVSWSAGDCGKLLVAEKRGVVRLYSTLSMQPISCLLLGTPPLTAAAWSTGYGGYTGHIGHGGHTGHGGRPVAVLAAGQLIVAALPATSQMVDGRTIHPGGGYAVAMCPLSSNYIATAGRPGSSLKISHAKNKQAMVSTSLEMFGGFSWHCRLPYLCVGNNTKISIYKISPK